MAVGRFSAKLPQPAINENPADAAKGVAMQIFGVDFSGARADRNTWLTQGVLRNDGSLVLEECRRVKRRELEDLLRNTQGPAVAALDFPFSTRKGQRPCGTCGRPFLK